MVRRNLDQYYTPKKSVNQLFDALPFTLNYSQVFEPCSGQGVFVSEILNRYKGVDVITNDIDDIFNTDYHFDAADQEAWEEAKIRPDWVITNPPFTKAPWILRNALNFSRKGVISLVRLSYLEPCANRREQLKNYKPDILYVTKRISFTGDNKTDNVTTVWIVWVRDRFIPLPEKRIHFLT